MRDRGSLAVGVAFAAAFLVAGLFEAALAWADDRSLYADFARDARLDRVAFHTPEGDRTFPLAVVLVEDEFWRSFVLGEATSGSPEGRVIPLGAAEISHMRDVARVFAWVRPSAHVAALAALALLAVGLRRAPRAIRRAAVVDVVAVAAVGAAAAVAFEPLFDGVFHPLFFPEGNFIFDPRTQNLVLLYPEDYFLAVTLRIGATFAAAALAIVALASVPIASASLRK